MAKPRSPLLSLGARGTIADALTYQKRGREHIVRQKPIPKDPYTLAQAYQRWDYLDYAYLWTQQSEATKQEYRTKGARYHLTGFSEWMSEKLTYLPDITGRWHLDKKAGATAYDSSRNKNDGTIIGASPATGTIDNAYYFDGINDFIRIPHSPILNIGSAITLEAWVKPTTVVGIKDIIGKWQSIAGQRSYLLCLTGNKVIFYLRKADDSAHVTITSTISVTTDWTFIVATWDGTTMRLYINGVLDPNTATISAVQVNTVYLGIAHYLASTQWFKGTIDEVIVRNTILPLELIKRHSERRYPS